MYIQKKRWLVVTGWCIWISICCVFLQQCGLSHKGGHSDTTYVIRMAAVPGLRYDTVRFQVPVGARVKVILSNKDDMDHNLVFTRPGKREKIVQMAQKMGGDGPQRHYIPETEEVMWHLATVQPGDSQVVEFTAPDHQGVYPYVCTYPGHGATMYGAMYVGDKSLPPLDQDSHIPSVKRKTTNTSDHQHLSPLHPYVAVPPYVIRTFMPQCGPAALAVRLTDSLSYCFDAGSCYLQYCWKGSFLNHADLWQRKGDEVAKIAGPLFFSRKTGFPLRLGKAQQPPEVHFKGYTLKGPYPELHYQVAKWDVYQTLLPASSGDEIIQHFRIPHADEPVLFLVRPEYRNQIKISKGTWDTDGVQLTATEAQDFSISISVDPKKLL